MSAGAQMTPSAPPLRIAEYSVYPRTARDHRLQAGFTRHEAGSGFVLLTTAPEGVGELLRVRIQGISMRDGEDTLARVAACNEMSASRYELQLEALDARAPRRVRRRG